MEKLKKICKNYLDAPAYAFIGLMLILWAIILSAPTVSPQIYKSEPMEKEVHYQTLCKKTDKQEDCMKANKLATERKRHDEIIRTLGGIDSTIAGLMFILCIFFFVSSINNIISWKL